jgi:hypothetical protein
MNSPKKVVMRFAQFATGKTIPFRLRTLATKAGLM